MRMSGSKVSTKRYLCEGKDMIHLKKIDLGFMENGEMDGDEIVAVLKL